MFNAGLLDSFCDEILKDCVVITIDPDGRLLSWTPEMTRYFGYTYDELAQDGVFRLHSTHHQKARSALRTALATGKASYQHWLYRKDGSSFQAQVVLHLLSPMPAGGPAISPTARLAVVFRSLESERPLRDWVIQASRLANLGMLSASTIHEINNPLAYVITNLQLQIEKLELQPAEARNDSDLLRQLRRALEGAERIRTIIRSAKQFSRLGAEHPEPALVHPAIEHAIQICQAELRYSCQVQILTSPEMRDLCALADSSRLIQVLVNLLINSSQAFSEPDVSRNLIRVSASVKDNRVEIEVSDNGPGIPEAIRAKIFEPFFSTKPRTEGSGLGLFICKSILAAYGGQIAVESGPEGGATFRIRLLPAASIGGSKKAPDCKTAESAEPGASILIVDDDADVAAALATLLRRQYRVELTTNSRQALESLTSRQSGSFDVVFCDLSMPGVDGPSFYDGIRASRPGDERRIIFMTGGAFNERLRRFLDTIDNPRIEKPFEPEEVKQAISQVMKQG